MFTIADIRNIAVQIEQNGEQTYRQAAEETSDPGIASILNRLADDEDKHAKWFTSTLPDKELTPEQKELEAVGRTLLQDIVRNQTFSLEQSELSRAVHIEDVLRQAITFEQDTIGFYEILQGFLDDNDAVAQLGRIIDEERHHVDQLKEMLASYNGSLVDAKP